MGIDLSTDKNELKYCYSVNGATLGPFTLTQFLDKINAETLVYRECIDWTDAKDVEELRKFISLHQNETSRSIVSSLFSTISNNISKPKKMFNASFSFEGRILRTEYGIIHMIYMYAYGIIAVVAEPSNMFF